MWLRTQVQPRMWASVCVCVCFIFPKDNLPPHPPHSNTHTQTHTSHTPHRCPNTLTFLEESFISLFGLLLVRALDALLPPPPPSSSSSPPPPCPALLSPPPPPPLPSLPLSQPSFLFFSSSILCVQVVSDGGTGAALPSPRSFNNNTVSILMLIWRLQPFPTSVCLFLPLLFFSLFSLSLLSFQSLPLLMFSSTAPNAAAAAAREGRERSGDKKERGRMHRNREREGREGKGNQGRGEKRQGGKRFAAAAAGCCLPLLLLRATRSAFGGVSLGGWWNCRRDEGGGSLGFVSR